MACSQELTEKLRFVRRNLKEEYLNSIDDAPWLVGFSGGKDSVLLTQLVIESLLAISPDERVREVYIVCNDTLVESPVFLSHLNRLLAEMADGFLALRLPISVVKTTPDTDDTFWVNLLGKGYPAPNPSFRWCVERLKIRPTKKFLQEKVSQSGRAVLLLGVRKAESAARAQRIEKYTALAGNTRLVPHSEIPGCGIFRPIMDLTTSEVWEALKGSSPPWGGSHDGLFTLYRDANAGEWPFVVDDGGAPPTASPMLARFGCWTCTVVGKDRSLESLADRGNDVLSELLAFRNRLKDFSADPEHRSKTRRDGRHGLGPLTFEAREMLLDDLLNMQQTIGLRLISAQEVNIVRNQWARDEFTTSLRDLQRLVSTGHRCSLFGGCAECTCRGEAT